MAWAYGRPRAYRIVHKKRLYSLGTTLLFLLCFSPAILLALYCIALHLVNKLRNLPPSPFPTLPLIGHIYLLRKPFHRSLSEVSRQYGPALFLQLGCRPALLISSPSLAEECFSNKNDVIFANRPNLLNGRYYGYNYTSLSWSSYGDHWRNLRRISSLELLSSRRIQMFSCIRADETLSMVRKLFCVTMEEPHRAIEVKSALFEYMFNVRRAKENGDCPLPSVEVKRKAMVEVLLDLQRSEPEYYTDETIKNLLLVLLQGGTSTSTIALEWAFTLLLHNPETLKKAQSEIDERVGHSRLIAEADVTELPYLRYIILETMRLHPPVSILMPHRSSAECAVGGFRVPAGTVLLVNVWDIHHSQEIWDDPDEFRPERFEGIEGKRDLGIRFLPFGMGRRACPGENLALANIGIALGAMIQCFDWEKVGEIDMTEGAGTTTAKVQPLTAKCTPRPFVVNFLSCKK